MDINKMDLIHAFKSMLTVARQYDLDIPNKYEELEETLLDEHDLSVMDMMGSMEHVYQILLNDKEIKS